MLCCGRSERIAGREEPDDPHPVLEYGQAFGQPAELGCLSMLRYRTVSRRDVENGPAAGDRLHPDPPAVTPD